MPNLTERNTFIDVQDENGNIERHYPITKFDNILEMPTADPETDGIMKLYDEKGQNEDGTMTQKVISEQIDTKEDILTNSLSLDTPVVVLENTLDGHIEVQNLKGASRLDVYHTDTVKNSRIAHVENTIAGNIVLETSPNLVSSSIFSLDTSTNPRTIIRNATAFPVISSAKLHVTCSSDYIVSSMTLVSKSDSSMSVGLKANLSNGQVVTPLGESADFLIHFDAIDKFLAVGSDGAAVSTAASSWTATGSFEKTLNIFNDIAQSDEYVVLVGEPGASYYMNTDLEWTKITALDNDYYSVCYNGEVFVAVGEGGDCAYTSDPSTGWTKVNGIRSAGCYTSVCYGNDRFVAVWDDGATYYSLDGVTWVAMTGLAGTGFETVCYIDGQFVTVGSNGKSYYSTDGEVWASLAGLESAEDTMFKLYTCGDMIIAVGNTTKSTYSITNGTNWSFFNIGNHQGDSVAFAYDNGIYFAIFDDYTSYYSYDACSWYSNYPISETGSNFVVCGYTNDSGNTRFVAINKTSIKSSDIVIPTEDPSDRVISVGSSTKAIKLSFERCDKTELTEEDLEYIRIQCYYDDVPCVVTLTKKNMCDGIVDVGHHINPTTYAVVEDATNLYTSLASYFPVKYGDTYVFSYKRNAPEGHIIGYDINKLPVEVISTNTITTPFKIINRSIAYVHIQTKLPEGVTTLDTEFQFETGTTKTAYSPYYSKEIEISPTINQYVLKIDSPGEINAYSSYGNNVSITYISSLNAKEGDVVTPTFPGILTASKPNLKVYGKNLYNFYDIDNENVTYSSKACSVSGDRMFINGSSAVKSITYTINTPVERDYTFSFVVSGITSSATATFKVNDTETIEKTLTENGLMSYTFESSVVNSVTLTATNNQILTFDFLQLEYGTEATTYDKYNSFEVKLEDEYSKLGEYYDELCISNSTFFDTNEKEINPGEWYKKKQVAAIQLDSIESWTTSPTETGGYYRLTTNVASKKIKIPSTQNDDPYLLSTHFIPTSESSSKIDHESGTICIDSSGNLEICLDQFSDGSADAIFKFKRWLFKNKPVIYYVLKTEEYYSLIDKDQETLALFESYNNYTTIIDNSNVLPDIKIMYPATSNGVNLLIGKQQTQIGNLPLIKTYTGTDITIHDTKTTDYFELILTKPYNILSFYQWTMGSLNTSGTWKDNTYYKDELQFQLVANKGAAVTEINVSGSNTTDSDIVFYLSDVVPNVAVLPSSKNMVIQNSLHIESEECIFMFRESDGTGHVIPKNGLTIPASYYDSTPAPRIYIKVPANTANVDMSFKPMITSVSDADKPYMPGNYRVCMYNAENSLQSYQNITSFSTILDIYLEMYTKATRISVDDNIPFTVQYSTTLDGQTMIRNKMNIRSMHGGDGTVISSNANYSEIGEWTDQNPTNENRVGYFVSVDNETNGITMVKATSTSDVRGATIANPAFAANVSSDKFGEDGDLLPKYDYVGFIGLIPIIDNGTCTVNDLCMPADDGTAVPAITGGYQVIDRIDATHVLVLLEPGADNRKRMRDEFLEFKESLDEVDNKSSETIRSELTKKNVTDALGYTPIDESKKGQPNGFASLDTNGQVPESQLPSYVDDVLEGTAIGTSESSDKKSMTATGFKLTGESSACTPENDKIYIDTTLGIQFRWSGSVYVSTGSYLALGETSATAYRGDRGKVAYDHSQSAHAPATAATASANGYMTKEYASKLDGIAAGANKYIHPTSGVAAGSYTKVTVDVNGHVTGGSTPTTLAGLGVTEKYAGSDSVGGAANKVKVNTASANADRPVWFADSTDSSIMNQDSDFKYNPSTNQLTTGRYNLSGKAYLEYSSEAINFVFN